MAQLTSVDLNIPVAALSDTDAQRLCDDMKRYHDSSISDRDAYNAGCCQEENYSGWDYGGITVPECKSFLASCTKNGCGQQSGLIETCYWIPHRAECPPSAANVAALATCLRDYSDAQVALFPKFANMTCEQIRDAPKNAPELNAPPDAAYRQSCASFFVGATCPIFNPNAPSSKDAGRD